MRPRIFDWGRTGRSFVHAGRGLRDALASEPNLRIHVVIAVVVLGAAWLLAFSAVALALLATVAGLVLTAELFNTTLEASLDQAWPQPSPLVRFAKDAAAAAVLITAVAAVVVGLLLFGHRLLSGSV